MFGLKYTSEIGMLRVFLESTLTNICRLKALKVFTYLSTCKQRRTVNPPASHQSISSAPQSSSLLKNWRIHILLSQDHPKFSMQHVQTI